MPDRIATAMLRFALALAIPASILNPAIAASAQGGAVTTIMLKDGSDISDAEAVNSAISALVKDADTCNPRSQACICGFTSGLDRLSNAYRNAVAKHPGWGQPGTGVEYYTRAKGTVAIVMSNVRRELQMCGRH
jgi:hypothetical protein